MKDNNIFLLYFIICCVVMSILTCCGVEYEKQEKEKIETKKEVIATSSECCCGCGVEGCWCCCDDEVEYVEEETKPRKEYRQIMTIEEEFAVINGEIICKDEYVINQDIKKGEEIELFWYDKDRVWQSVKGKMKSKNEREVRFTEIKE